MIHNLKEYYSYSVKDKNLLIYSNSDFSKFTKIFEVFNSYKICDITELSIDSIGAYIATNKIDTILMDITPEAYKIYDALESLTQRISLILYLRVACEEPHSKLINMSEAIIAEPFDEDILMYKFFTMLNSESAINSMKNAANSISKLPSIDKNNLEDYLDTYEGQILFLSESLQDNISFLDSGELNKELLSTLSEQIEEVASVFSNHHYTKKVTPIFLELSSYLKTLEISKVAINNIEGFEYLARIIEDINSYMIEYFVDRVFTDVYVFEDSLENSIKFMEDKLSSTEDKSSELEFF